MQAKRKEFAHYIDTDLTGSNENYVREGIGVEALSLEYNAQIDNFKTILDDVSDNTFKNYEITASIDNKRIDRTDSLWDYLNYLRKNCIAGETKYLEVDMGSLNNGSYEGLLYNVLITINNFLGEDATISYNIAVKKSPKIGTVTFVGGKPVFTEPVSL